MTYCFNCGGRIVNRQHWKLTMYAGGYWSCKTKGKS